jgi:hypothetical protein
MPVQLSFDATPEPPSGKLIFSLEVDGRLPSWNEILGMEQWARYKFKGKLANDFLFALRRSAADSSTKTTCARNTMLTFADTLARFLETKQAARKLKQRSKRLAAKSASLSALKSSLFEKPPF